jgi:hypothetical protein
MNSPITEQILDNTVVVETKKKPVLKAIPKKIMGYLKFAHFVLGSNDDSIVSKLFLDKSIEEIVSIVNDVVENGNQDKTINELRKQLINSAKPKKTRAKKVKKTNDADAIVTDLVTLARTTDTPDVPKKTRAKKVNKIDNADVCFTDLVTLDTITDTPALPTETPALPTETAVVEKKVRAKKTKATKATHIDESLNKSIHTESNGTAPTESNGTAPTESNGTAPTESNGTTPTESNGTTPTETKKTKAKKTPLQTQITASLIADPHELHIPPKKYNKTNTSTSKNNEQ